MGRGTTISNAAVGEAPDEARAVMLRRSGVLEATSDPDLERWIVALQRDTAAAVSAFSMLDGASVFVKCVATGDGTVGGGATLEDPVSLEDYLLGLVAPAGGARRGAAYAEVPVTVDGQLLGLLSIGDRGPRDWSEVELRTLADSAAAVSTEVALRLARGEVGRVRQLVESHNKVHDLIARAEPLHDVLLTVVESIERHDPSIIACVVLLDPATSTLHPGAGPSLPAAYLAAIDGAVIGPNVGTCGSAAWSGQLTITADIGEDPRWAPIRELAQRAGLGHCWSMPVKAPGGEVLGTLAFYGPRPRRPLPEHLALLQDWSRVVGIAIERHRALERLIHDARHDGLTGLPNRTAILEALDEAIPRARPDSQVAVLFVDLDGLKKLNDTLGHDRADEMLREVGERLSAAVSADDLVGRFGGDEFVVISEGVDEVEAGRIGLSLLEAISKPLPCIDSAVITGSIGVTLVRSDAVEAREVLREADSAMYAAKRSGRDRCVFFEGGQRVRTGRRLRLARALRGAEKRGELRLVFQPVVALPALEIVGVEALLRWSNPGLGEVSPTEFVPVGEDTGAIVPVGAWALRESCETMAGLAKELGCRLELEVNVSSRQLANPGFALSVRQTLAHAEFPADLLSLDITETALARPNAVTARTLRELHSLGVQIVLDGFGTGFSSLAWLKQHPLGAIKVDRSFVNGLSGDGRDRAIVAAVIGMAAAMGCAVTAVGVETEEQLAVLRSLGCERAQGFLLGRPVPADALGALVRRGTGVARVGRPPQRHAS
ncbi:MAG TPA: EAL domain-containing protein [Acidimicrobiales bacterium]|nr:EAL domain-containing protein [Acidimicrobiales bacterium]